MSRLVRQTSFADPDPKDPNHFVESETFYTESDPDLTQQITSLFPPPSPLMSHSFPPQPLSLYPSPSPRTSITLHLSFLIPPPPYMYVRKLYLLTK